MRPLPPSVRCVHTAIAVALVLGLAACDRHARPPATMVGSTTTTSGSYASSSSLSPQRSEGYASRPERLPPPSRAVDSTGFVDNGGRTSDLTGRGEASGMRATEAGSQRPTGTPGSGTPLPIDGKAKRAPRIEGAPEARFGLGPRGTAGAPADAIVGRAAQALCDRERACERLGTGGRWQTTASCVDDLRSTVGDDLSLAACPDGFDSTAVASCLTEIRRSSCDAPLDRLSSQAGCDPRMLCLRR